MSIETGETLPVRSGSAAGSKTSTSDPSSTMNDACIDSLALTAYETTKITSVTFKLATKPDGSVTCLQMMDKNGEPFPGDDIVVEQDKLIEFVNATVLPGGGPDTCGTLVIFFQKQIDDEKKTSKPGTPIKYGDTAKLIRPRSTWEAKTKKLTGNKAEAYSFSAVALTANGDVATFDPRIIIKPQ